MISAYDTKTFRCWYSNGSAVLVNAYTLEDAKQMADEQAASNGYPGLSIEKIENLSEK